ncbi:MAG: DUF4142 domain-containing protein [Verrucomicrobiota bacterium]
MKRTAVQNLFRRVFQPGLIVTLASVCCLSLTADERKLGKNADEKFIKEAAKGGMKEVQMGQLGVDKAQNPQVKEFAQRLVQDHSKANQELKQIAQKKGIELPSETEHKDKDHEAKWSDKSGAEFDNAFVKHMIKDHKKDIQKFEKAAAECEDQELKAFAQKTLPTLRQHLQTAQNLAGTLGVDVASLDQEFDREAERIDATSAPDEGRILGADRDRDAVGAAPGAETGRDTPPQGQVDREFREDRAKAKDREERKDLTYSDLPEAVRSALRAEGDVNQIEKIKEDIKDGKTTYKVEFRQPGLNKRVTVNEDGTILKNNKKD